MSSTGFGTTESPSGMMSTFGQTPGSFRAYDQGSSNLPPARFDMFVAPLTTTPDALRQILPYPLSAPTDLPPQVFLVHLEAEIWRGWDGRNKHYNEIGIWAPAAYGDHVGVTLLHLYLEGNGANQATVAAREQWGVGKLIASVDTSKSEDGSKLWSTAVDQGQPRIYMHADCREPVPSSEAPLRGLANKMLCVKEIPNFTFDGYDVRKVIMMDWGYLSGDGATTLMTKGHADVQLWEPLDSIPILEVGPAYHYRAEKPGASNYTDKFANVELCDLLKQEPAQVG
jgi:hypothetical protein